MSGEPEGAHVPPCLHVVPGHHPSLAQVADAGRHRHRIVEAIAVEDAHTLQMTLDGGERAVARCHNAAEVDDVWPHRAGVATWNPTVRLLGIPVCVPPDWGTAWFHLTEGAFTRCDELVLAEGFDELVDGALGDLREVGA